MKITKSKLGFDDFTFVDLVGLVYKSFTKKDLIFVGRTKIRKKVEAESTQRTSRLSVVCSRSL